MIEKIDNLLSRLRPYQVLLIFSSIALLVFGRSLFNSFIGDDFSQIINNPVIQSIQNFPLFFQGGTFYVDGGIAPLFGAYYRPLMTVTFSVIYSIFGDNAFYYHFIQLALHVATVMLVYLLFRLSTKPIFAFSAALLFMLHPFTSQSVYAIASMQEVLMSFFGLLGLWLLVRFQSKRALWLTAICLLVALLAKESAMLFVLMAIMMLALWDRKRLKLFAWLAGGVTVIWFTMRVLAVGFFTNPHNAPITDVSFWDRLMTMPSVFTYYLSHFIAPIKLSSMSYWTVSEVSFAHVVFPAIVALITCGVFAWLGYAIYKKADKSAFQDFMFYAAWFILSYGVISQIHALDMTASPAWFYVPSIGLLGMIVVSLTHLVPDYYWYVYTKTIGVIFITILLLFTGRTFARGFNWSDEVTLSLYDIKVSSNEQDNFNFAQSLALSAYDAGDYTNAAQFAQRSVDAYPKVKNTFLLGKIQYAQGAYMMAYTTFDTSTKYQLTPSTYEYMALCLLHTGNSEFNRAFYEKATSKFPSVANLWQVWAVYEYTQTDTDKDTEKAKALITKALETDGNNSQIVSTYKTIMAEQPLDI